MSGIMKFLTDIMDISLALSYFRHLQNKLYGFEEKRSLF